MLAVMPLDPVLGFFAGQIKDQVKSTLEGNGMRVLDFGADLQRQFERAQGQYCSNAG